MRLFLSSENVGKYPQELVRLSNGKRLLYIANARDFLDDKEKGIKTEKHKIQFEDLSFEFTELDLRDYFHEKVSQEVLNNFDIVWCPGGNTFLLRYAVEESGLAAILKSKIENNEIAYGGSSAGAILPGPTLKGSEFGDNPDAVNEIYGGDAIWDGLGVVDFIVAPHWKSDWFGDESRQVVNYLEANGDKYMKLEDGQVYLVDGDKQELLK